MKRRLVFFAILSLSLGIVLTTLLAYKKTDIHQYGDCAKTALGSLPSDIRRVDCSGRAYGFPFTFAQAEPRVDVSYVTEPLNTSPVMLGVYAESNFKTGKLLANIAIWTVFSAALIGGGWYWLEHRDDEKPAVEKPKK